MEHVFRGTTIALLQGDITDVEADAIVNAANSSLMGGGGVDGAIHQKGGSAILDECQEYVAAHGSLATGEAMITTGGDLPAGHVIHTVGPVYRGGKYGEFVELESAYTQSLLLAKEHELKTVAFPSISTGAYKFPIDEAAYVALNTGKRLIAQNEGSYERLTFVLFSQEDYDVYAATFDEVITTMMG